MYIKLVEQKLFKMFPILLRVFEFSLSAFIVILVSPFSESQKRHSYEVDQDEIKTRVIMLL